MFKIKFMPPDERTIVVSAISYLFFVVILVVKSKKLDYRKR